MINIYLPCQVFEVPVIAGPSRRLSTLERLALEAIHAGVSQQGTTYFRDLIGLFHLGHRPTLDLIVDLWHRGYVAVDVEQRLWITEPVKQRINQLAELAGGETRQLRLPVMQELISGHTLTYQRAPLHYEPIQVAPPALEMGSLRRARRSEILRVLEKQLERHYFSREQEPWKVLEAHFGFAEIPGMAPQVRHSLLEVSLECLRDDEVGHLVFRVSSPDLDARACADIETALAALAEARPEHPFFKKLQEAARVGQAPPLVDPLAAAARLHQEVERARRVNRGNVTQQHAELLKLGGEVRRAADELRSRQVGVRWLASYDEHVSAIEALIAAANRQVVISSPLLHYWGFDRWRPAITEALKTGTTVFVLWGSRRDGTLETAIGNLLSDLTRDFPTRFLYSRRPARVQSNFLIADADRLLLTSWRFLDEPRTDELPESSFRDLGVEITTGPTATRPSPITEALDWSYDRSPERRIARRMYAGEGTPAGSEEGGHPEDPLRGHEPPAIEVELPSVSLTDLEYERAQLRLWRQQWEAVAAHYGELLAGAGLTGEWIVDGRHREVLWSTLRRPSRCLLILSWKIDPDVVKPAMIQALESRIQAGSRILIGFSEGLDRNPRLTELRSRYGEQLRLEAVRGAVRSLPQLLLTEDLCLLSSFGFLSFAGFYDKQRAPELSHNLGVLLRGTGATRHCLDGLAAWLPGASWLAERLDLQQTATTSGVPPAALPAVIVVPAGLQELLRLLRHRREKAQGDLTEQPRAELLRRWFQDADAADAWTALDALDAADLPDLSEAVASCLAVRQASEEPARRQRWLAWLVDHLWHHGEVWRRPENALSASILLALLAAPPARLPPSWMALLAASREQPELLQEGLIDGALRPSLDGGEVCALAAIAISAILGRPEIAQVSCEVVDALAERLPAALAQCAAAVRAFWTHTGQPLNAEALEHWLDHKTRRQQADALREELLLQLQRERERRFKFGLAYHTWSVLFGDEGPLQHLLSAVKTGNATSAGSWLESAAQDHETLLDRATEEGMARAGYLSDRQEEDRRIVGRYRLVYLRQIAEFLSKAQSWVALQRTGESLTDEHYHAAVLDLSRGVRHALPQLIALGAKHSGPEAPILAGLIAELRPLTELAA